MRACRAIQGILTVLLVPVFSTPAIAQSRSGLSVKVGEADLYPSVRIDYVSSDNAFLANDDTVDSQGILVKPRFELVANRRLLDVSLIYAGDYGSFDESLLNYDDHALSLGATANLATRHRVLGSLSVAKSHEDFGLNFTRGEPVEGSEQVEFTTTDLSAVHTFGAADAKGNVETGLLFRSRNYLNQDELTSGFDFSLVSPSVSFTYRLSSTARALLGVDYSIFNFDDNTLDRNDLSVFAGIRLAEGRKTSGTARLGFTNSDFDQAGRDDSSTLNAEIGLVYLPVSFAEIRLNIDRALDNADGVANAAASAQSVRDSFEIRWIHRWSSRVGSNAFVRRSNVSRDCPDVDTETTRAGFEMSVAVRQFLSIGAGIGQNDRSDSGCPGVAIDPEVDSDFDQTTFSVFLRAQL